MTDLTFDILFRLVRVFRDVNGIQEINVSAFSQKSPFACNGEREKSALSKTVNVSCFSHDDFHFPAQR